MAALPFTLQVADVPQLPPNASVALALAADGFHVFPCQPGGAEAKRPYPGILWRERSTTAEDTILSWWTRWPDAVPGIDLAKSGHLVIDADRHGGPDGVVAWSLLAGGHGFNPGLHPRVGTPSEGEHTYFQQRPGEQRGNARGVLPAGIDVRGHGGYVIGPGATMLDGRAYCLIDGSPSIANALPLPDWLADILTSGRVRGDHEAPASAPPPSPNPASASPITDIRLRAYVTAALDAELAKVAGAPKGGRNNTLNEAAFALGQMVGASWLGEAEARAQLMDAAQACGLVRDDGAVAAQKTIASGLTSGMKKPRSEPEDHFAAETERGAEIARRLVERANGDIVDEDTGEVVHDAGQAAAAALADVFPQELTNVPGLVGHIVDWIVASARRPNRTLALGAALTLVGTTMGRHWAGPTRAGTHLYILTLAPTSTGKDHALQQIKRILIAAGMNQCIGTDEFISMPAVINLLLRSPLCVCPMDELGGFLKRINGRYASGFERGITKALRTAWGTNYAPMLTPEWAGRPTQIVHAPHVSIFGASTAAEFFQALDGGDVANGFLNRFTLLSVEERPADRDPDLPPDKVPDGILAGMKALFGGGNQLVAASKCLSAAAEVDPVVIPWADQAARQVFVDLQAEVLAMMDRQKEAADFIARTGEMAVRLATIRAGGRDPVRPEVSVADIQWGRLVALWSANAMLKSAKLYMAETEVQGNANRVLRIIRDAGGRITHRNLHRRLQHRLKSRDLQDLMKSLVDSEAMRSERIVPDGGGTPTLWYILGTDDD